MKFIFNRFSKFSRAFLINLISWLSSDFYSPSVRILKGWEEFGFLVLLSVRNFSIGLRLKKKIILKIFFLKFSWKFYWTENFFFFFNLVKKWSEKPQLDFFKHIKQEISKFYNKFYFHITFIHIKYFEFFYYSIYSQYIKIIFSIF